MARCRALLGVPALLGLGARRGACQATSVGGPGGAVAGAALSFLGKEAGAAAPLGARGAQQRRLLASKAQQLPSLEDYRKHGAAEALSYAPFPLPRLPYAFGALAPIINEQPLAFHHATLHRNYAATLNTIAKRDRSVAGSSLFELIGAGRGPAFNVAAQLYNHAFFFANIAPPNADGSSRPPTGEIARLIEEQFQGIAPLQAAIAAQAKAHFGSGWIWLCAGPTNKLFIVPGPNAWSPLVDGTELRPLLVVDIWEHAYLLDYLSQKDLYVGGVMDKLINWDFVNGRLASSSPWDPYAA